MKPVSEAVVLTNLSRYSAWVAMLVVVLYILTGYGMTKRIIDPDLAKRLHQHVLPIPLFLSLILHGGISARGALRRWRVFKNPLSADAYAAVLGVVVLGLFVWLYLR
jgi:hypothetical protein